MFKEFQPTQTEHDFSDMEDRWHRENREMKPHSEMYIFIYFSLVEYEDWPLIQRNSITVRRLQTFLVKPKLFAQHGASDKFQLLICQRMVATTICWLLEERSRMMKVCFIGSKFRSKSVL